MKNEDDTFPNILIFIFLSLIFISILSENEFIILTDTERSCMIISFILGTIGLVYSISKDIYKKHKHRKGSIDWVKGSTLKEKLDWEQEYIYKLNMKFKDYKLNNNLKVSKSDIYFITFNEFQKTLTVIRRLYNIIDIIKIRDDFTKYANLINKQIPLAIKALKIYEKFFDNYFTLRELIEIPDPEVVLKKERQNYHVIKTKYDVSKLLKIIEVEFAHCLINNNTDDILAQIDDSLITDESLQTMSINKINIDDYVDSLEKSLSILKRMQINSKQKQIIDIVSQIIDYIKEISECLKKSTINGKPSTHFVDYYLPTTCKLLEEYIKIPNETLKAKITATFSRLIVVFEMERNKLLEKQNIDVDAELKVLNGEIDAVTLLKKER